jgi:hypothetical protein
MYRGKPSISKKKGKKGGGAYMKVKYFCLLGVSFKTIVEEKGHAATTLTDISLSTL